MVYKGRVAAAVLVASLVLPFAAASASAAGSPKSFSASFCYAATYGDISPAFVATVSWSGYRVDGVALGEGDGTGAGFGVVDPINPATRSGTDTVAILADDSSPFGGVDIRLGNHVWASQSVTAPSGSWANLPACP
jgi:hypothetical protein